MRKLKDIIMEFLTPQVDIKPTFATTDGAGNGPTDTYDFNGYTTYGSVISSLLKIKDGEEINCKVGNYTWNSTDTQPEDFDLIVKVQFDGMVDELTGDKLPSFIGKTGKVWKYALPYTKENEDSTDVAINGPKINYPEQKHGSPGF